MDELSIIKILKVPDDGPNCCRKCVFHCIDYCGELLWVLGFEKCSGDGKNSYGYHFRKEEVKNGK